MEVSNNNNVDASFRSEKNFLHFLYRITGLIISYFSNNKYVVTYYVLYLHDKSLSKKIISLSDYRAAVFIFE